MTEPITQLPPELDDRVRRALSFLLDQKGKPYFYGAEGPDEWDCSGLFRRTLLEGAFWPITGDANVATCWTAGNDVFPRVEWTERQPLDGVVFGDVRTGKAFHLVVVLERDHLVGANGGGPRWHAGSAQEEPIEHYRKRMADRGARVKVTGPDYWPNSRLGVIRPAGLLGVDLTRYALRR